MNTIKTTFRIVTPMFIAGANQDAAELRAPSIKGVLRFWYRAIDPEYAKHEARIFGGSGKGEGQAMFLLRLSEIKSRPGDKGDVRWNNSKTAYLGYGVIDRKPTEETYIDNQGNVKKKQKQMTVRPYLKERSQFTLSIVFKPLRPDAREEDRANHAANTLQVKRALWALLMFGGLGARNRKGFGSMVVTQVDGMDELPTLTPNNHPELHESIDTFLQTISKANPPPGCTYPEYTCFSDHSRCLVTKTQGNALSALKWLGEILHKYRSHRGAAPLSWVTTDHKLMRDWIQNGKKPSAPPLRTAFGLPHNYFFTSLGNKKGDVNLFEKGKKGRRASPVLFRIHEFPTEQVNPEACIVATFLPARLIPDGAKVSFDSDNHDTTEELALPDDFTAVEELLNKIKADGNACEVTW